MRFMQQRSSALARRPARGASSTTAAWTRPTRLRCRCSASSPAAAAVPSVQPFVYKPPAELDAAWRSAQNDWLQLAVNRPITIAGTSFHLLGTCHHDPVNPALVQAAAAALCPDCIAVEASATRLGVMSKACKDPSMQGVLRQLCSRPLEQCSLASHLSVEERSAWLQALNAALRASLCLALPASEDLPHFGMGHPRYSEEVTAAHIAATLNLPLLAIDLPAGHPANEQAEAFSFDGPEYALLGLQAMEAPLSPSGRVAEVQGSGAQAGGHGEGLRGKFEAWRDELEAQAEEASGSPQSQGSTPSTLTPEYVREFVEGVLAPSCLNPSQMEVYDSLDQALNPRAHGIVVQARDRYMAERLQDIGQAQGLARVMKLGPGAGWQPPKRVLVVMGRSHVGGVRSLLGGSRD